MPCSKDLGARQFANRFMKEIVRLHGLPHDIITDRGTLFTSDLWKETTGKLGIERKLRTAFHPQTDGQTERTNAILEQYLPAYINYQQDDWCRYLPLAEFAYNNGYLETMKNTPLFAKYGINPEYEMIGHLIHGQQTKPEEMTHLHESLRNEMVATQLRQKEYYDLHRKTRSEPTFRRDGVVVATKHQDHKTIEETGLQENQTIQNLGKDWDKDI